MASKGNIATIKSVETFTNKFTLSSTGQQPSKPGYDDPILPSIQPLIIFCLRLLTKLLICIIEHPNEYLHREFIWGKGKDEGDGYIGVGKYGNHSYAHTILAILMDLLFLEGNDSYISS